MNDGNSSTGGESTVKLSAARQLSTPKAIFNRCGRYDEMTSVGCSCSDNIIRPTPVIPRRAERYIEIDGSCDVACDVAVVGPRVPK